MRLIIMNGATYRIEDLKRRKYYEERERVSKSSGACLVSNKESLERETARSIASNEVKVEAQQ